MEIETLVGKITQEVMMQIKKMQIEPGHPRKALAMIWGGESSVDQNRINSFLQPRGIQSHFVTSYTIQDLMTSDFLVIPALSVSSLAWIAQGIKGDETSTFVLEGLLHGKRVLVLEDGLEYKRFKQTCPSGLYALYESYGEKLGVLGVRIGELKELTEGKTLSTPDVCGDEEQRTPIRMEEKVITEKKLEALDCQDRSLVSIPAKAIITPMAKDYIRKKHIQIARA